MMKISENRLKNNHCLNANSAEVIRVFPEAIRIFPIFRFPAINDQITMIKYHVYMYSFVAYLMWVLNMCMLHRLGLVIKEI